MDKIFIEIIKLSFYSFVPIAIFIYLSNNDNFKYSSKFKSTTASAALAPFLIKEFYLIKLYIKKLFFCPPPSKARGVARRDKILIKSL